MKDGEMKSETRRMWVEHGGKRLLNHLKENYRVIKLQSTEIYCSLFVLIIIVSLMSETFYIQEFDG